MQEKIVFINQDSGYLMVDIINAHIAAGFSCVLITGRLVERNTKLHPSVKVCKIIKYNRETTFNRLLTWVIGYFQIWINVVIRFRKDTLFIVSNPPFAPLLPLTVKNPYKLLIFDIYPDALSELGYLSDNSIIIKLWRKSNKSVFAKAISIYTLTDGMRLLLEQYAGDKPIEVVPLWTDNSFLKPVNPDKNPFIEKHNLSGKFIVMYSGNLGLSSNVEILLDIAARTISKNLTFIIIGNGARKEKLVEKAIDLNLQNVIFLPWQPVDELPYSLASANLALVFLGSNASRLAVPSKLYDILSVGVPLLCVTTKDSAVEKLVAKYDCGKSFNPDDLNGMINYIHELSENNQLCVSMSENSAKASKNFNFINATNFLDKK